MTPVASRAFQPRHVLLTGAAGAIGSALTGVLSARHPELRFSLVDRNGEGMATLADKLGGRANVLPWDLANPSTLPTLWEQATDRFGGIDLLINCAGFMEIRSFAATPWELGDRLLQVDLISPLRLMNLAVQGLRAGNQTPRGWIVNISSMAGRVPLRGCSYYGAAKSGLALASQIAGMELRSAGIHVLTVLPGPVFSGLESRARGQVQQGLVSRYIPTGDPSVLADRIERALHSGRKRLVYPTVYAIADRMIGASSSFTATFSPDPTDAP
jgi:short-subunit dehydrogenase